MEIKQLLLTRIRRRDRRELIFFLDSLSLFLLGGFELGYAWEETLQLGEGGAFLKRKDGESTAELLERMAENYPNPDHRLWFRVLGELYKSGAPLAEAIPAMANAIRQEGQRELDDHCRTLPMRLNVGLILFFLPPVLLLLFAPLLQEILGAF